MNASEPYNEREILLRFRNGDQRAFQKIYERYKDPLYRFIKSYVKEREYAEEIVQDSFVKLWQVRVNIDMNQPFEAYLFTISKRKIYRFLKKAADDRELRENIFCTNQINLAMIEQSTDWQSYEHLAKAAIDSLPEKRKKIFLLLFEDGLTYAEISNRLEISPSTVRSQVQSGLKDIRQYFRANSDLYFPFFLAMFLASS